MSSGDLLIGLEGNTDVWAIETAPRYTPENRDTSTMSKVMRMLIRQESISHDTPGK